MPQGGTPPLVPMWPQPQARDLTRNPYPFFPFDPRWGDQLPMMEFETFCAMLRLAWVSPRPCYLPPETAALDVLLEPYRLRGGGPVTDRVMGYFKADAKTGLLYFPPQLRALRRLVNGENMYALLWDEEK